MVKMLSLSQIESYMIGLGFSKIPVSKAGCPDPFPKFYFNVDNTDYHYDIIDFKFIDGLAVIDFDFYYGKYELSKYIIGYNKHDKYRVELKNGLDCLYNLFLENKHMAPLLRDKQIEKVLK